MTETTKEERGGIRQEAITEMRDDSGEKLEIISPYMTMRANCEFMLRLLNDADRLAQIEQSLEALADRMRVADENLTHDGRHREAQFVRDWLSDVRAIIDAPDDGGED